ncbi:restriction endonuclease subunit S [Rhodovulum visakhapatnamense]|uniref:Restriction endonuclease subunit S n=1 Tax=Rhodovulum visakhapatnamense TaxID=364297 RepID=A0ABS1RLG3_9RHOB|nr:restriction endonuclease subunit S [Rhodovulum visakhapatnamense]MBL3571915.1 restriction endonuclease subunit S [Rhodovulum visakhapatnamense]MBL3580494.1 restriction endonuclease subunit S [Rhodovulum visakhapatnamense]
MSGIDAWQSELPPAWSMRPLRSVAEYAVSNVDKILSDGELPVRLCNYTDVYNNEKIHLGMEFMAGTATQSEISKFHLIADDVVITKDSEAWDDIGIPALVTETADDFVCGYHLAMIRPDPEKLDGAFLFRCLQSKTVRVQLELAANGITRFGIPKSAIGSLALPVPPTSIQRSIARFLDSETADIDALIAAKQKLLDLMAEKRRAIVAEAIVRGLDPSAPLRPSGIDWLGDIPAHWEIERSRWLFTERDQRSQTGEEEMLTVSHLTGVTPRSEKDVNMFEAESTAGYKLCFAGDLAINTLWAWMGAMGTARVDGIVSPAYNVYTPGPRLLPDYVDALVRIPVFAKEVTRYSKGVWSSRLRLYPEGFFETYWPVPPLGEQQQIVAHITAETKKIDRLRVATENSIALLKERRSALIAAAVTGQLEIPEAA